MILHCVINQIFLSLSTFCVSSVSHYLLRYMTQVTACRHKLQPVNTSLQSNL